MLLYWLENLVIGVSTIGRITVSSIGNTGPIALLGAVITCAFFTLHYGLFCLAHGGLLLEFFGVGIPLNAGAGPLSIAFDMVWAALQLGPNLGLMLCLVGSWQALQFLAYIRDGAWKGVNPQVEMMMPYGRVIVLHAAVFAAGAAVAAAGDPAIGLLFNQHIRAERLERPLAKTA